MFFVDALARMHQKKVIHHTPAIFAKKHSAVAQVLHARRLIKIRIILQKKCAVKTGESSGPEAMVQNNNNSQNKLFLLKVQVNW